MNYVILSLLVISIAIIYDRKKIYLNREIRLLFLLVICLLLCGFAGLRSSYNDTKSYIAIFQSTPANFGDLFIGEFAIGSAYLNKIFNYLVYHMISDNYHVYFFICSVFFVVPAIYVMDKYSDEFSFSVFLLMVSGLYLFSLAAVRQSIAMGILMLSADAFIQKKYSKFIFLCLIASSFHLYSILMLVLILMKGDKIFGIKIIVMCLMVLYIGSEMTRFSEYVSEVASAIGKDISSEEISTGSVSLFRALVYLAPFMLAFLSRHIINQENYRSQNTFITLSVLSTAFMILALFGNPILLGRIPYYFVIGTVVSLPYIINNAFTRDSVRIVKVITIICYCGFELYELKLDQAFAEDIFNLMWF